MSGVAGLRGTGDWGTDERPKSFRENILFYSPNGNAPLFALTSKAGKKTVNDPEFSWWIEPQQLVRLQVNGAFVAGDTTITVDSSDPTITTAGVAWGTATHLKPGDLLMVEPSADNATFNHEVLMVEEVLSNTQIVVSRGAAGTTPASISNDAYLFLIGSAYAEGTDAPSAVSRNPLKNYNYTQIFKDTYELSGTAAETEARTGNPWSNDKKRKTFDHARDIELAMLFGQRSEGTGDNGKPLRTMGGLRTFIPSTNVTVFGAPVTGASLLDAVAPVFNFDMGGGDSRIVFCGNTARIELGKVIQNETGITMELGETITMWGMKFEEFITPMGTLLFRTHPLMSQHSLYKKAAFIVDFAAIRYVALRNRDTKTKDDIQNKGEDLRKGLIQTECSLMVDGGGLTCGYLGNISQT